MSQASDAGQSSQHTHIEAIRAGQQGYIEIGAIAGDPDDIRHKRYIQRWFFLTGDNTADLLLLIDQLAAKYGNVYCSRVLYEQPRRDRALALPTRLLFLDDAPPGSYTFTIETSPKSMHAYILLDELISTDQAEQLGRRLAYQHGADQGGWDITQIVRVPGTLNTKAQAGGRYDDKRRWIAGSGHPITLTRRTERAYSVAEITEATQTSPVLPIDALDPASVAVWQGNLADLLTPDGLPKRWKNPNITGWKVLRGEYHPQSSSEARYIIIASLVLHGYPDDEIAALGIHLTNFGKMETKGSAWLYRDIARCTRKARMEFAEKGWSISINPSQPGRTRAPADIPRQSPARRGRKCKGSPAGYYDRLMDEASGDQVHWTLSQAAAAMGVGVATIKRWEVILKALGRIDRVTVSTRQHSYVAILGQLKIHESTPNQADLEVSSQISVQRVLTPQNDDRAPNAWENHRGASRPPATPLLAPSVLPVAAPSLLDDQADAASASFEPVADDQAEEAPAIVLALADDQADETPAIGLALADDQADILPPRDELLCGVELRGPAGALAVLGGAAYVPSGTEPWYAAICATLAPLAPDQTDDQAEIAQLLVPLDAGDLADDLTEAIGAGDVSESNDQIIGTPAKRARRRRSCKDPKRKKLDEQRQEVERWRRMDLPRLEIERSKLAAASQDVRRPAQQREKLAEKLPRIDVEIGRKRSAGIQAMYQAANDTTRPPANEPAGPVAGMVRRTWRSLIARCDWDTPPALVPPALVAPCVPELAAEGWSYERDGSAWRAVHVAGYETAAYINPEAAGRAVERREYYPVVG